MEEADFLRHVMFVVWGFPEPTQTFIHRELTEMARGGGEVRILASHRMAGNQSTELDTVADRAVYLGTRTQWIARALRYGTRHPRRLSNTLRWMASLPHRSHRHRARAMAMVLAAASVADRMDDDVHYIHAHFAGYHTELAMSLARLLDLPWGATFHAVGIWRDRNILPVKVREAKVLMTCTENNQKHLQALVPSHEANVHLVYHGLDFSELGPVTPLPSETPTRWLATGRLVEKKGFQVLLEAAAQLRARDVSFKLDLVGDGPERPRLERTMRELDLEGHVQMHGSLPNDAVLARMRQAHGLVAPSIQTDDGNVDGIPNVVIEAMACGRAVVASRLSGIPEVVQPGKTGVLTPPGDPRQLADALERLGGNPDQLSRMGQSARQLVERKFDVRENVRQQLQLLRAAATA